MQKQICVAAGAGEVAAVAREPVQTHQQRDRRPEACGPLRRAVQVDVVAGGALAVERRRASVAPIPVSRHLPVGIEPVVEARLLVPELVQEPRRQARRLDPAGREQRQAGHPGGHRPLQSGLFRPGGSRVPEPARAPVLVGGHVVRQRLLQVVALAERRPPRQPAAVVGVHRTPPFDFGCELERAVGRQQVIGDPIEHAGGDSPPAVQRQRRRHLEVEPRYVAPADRAIGIDPLPQPRAALFGGLDYLRMRIHRLHPILNP